MARLDVLALVLAGGEGSRMEVLTQDRAKPALPFAGVYRLLDFSLSNLRNSGVDDVWVLVQFETQSILDVLAGGRPWDLDRSHGGLRIVPPQQESDGGGGWHEGNAHALYANRSVIAEAEPDDLLVLSADHVYKLDLAPVVEQHRRTGAEATVVTTRMPLAQAGHHAVLDVTADGLVRGIEVKPEKPSSGVVATEIFVYDTAIVLEVLSTLADDARDEDGAELADFGDRLLPALIERGKVHEYRMSGYWKDVGRPESYFAAHRDVLVAQSRRRGSALHLDDDTWPLLTHGRPRMPALVEQGGRVVDSLISPACQIAGRVERSVLGPGTVVQEGAIVRDAILMSDVTVRSGARIQHAIVDDGATIGGNAVVGSARIAGDLPTTDELVLIGAKARIAAGAKVPAGDRVDRGGRRRAPTA